MKPYEKYKESGVEWIGEVPEHWEVSSIKYQAKVIGRIGYRGYTVDDIVLQGEGAISLSPSNIQNQKFDLKKRTYISWNKYDESPEIQIFEGDVILVKTASVGKVALITNLEGEKATINPQLVVFKNILLSNVFFYYYLMSNDFQYQIDRDNYGGVVGTLSQASINSYRILIPTLQEQTAIAKYLDHQTAIIDELIEKKTKQIALLKEKRQAIINETVTKGLDPTAKMKDSGVSWLGEIPESWEVTRLRYLGKCQNGVSQGSEYFGSGDPFVNYSDVYKNIALPKSVSGLAKSTDADKENYSVIEGDIFFTRTSETIEEIGLSSVCLNTIKRAVFAGFLIRFRPIPNVLDKDFSKYYFRSHIPRVYFVKEMNLVTRASLSQELLKSLPVLLPSLEEQQVLAQFLDKQVEKMNSTILEIESAVQKLKEYRQSLISEAVTGKIDVRGWGALIQEEA